MGKSNKLNDEQREAYGAMASELNDIKDDLSVWENEFVTNINDQIEKGYLTDAQIEKLEELHTRHL